MPHIIRCVCTKEIFSNHLTELSAASGDKVDSSLCLKHFLSFRWFKNATFQEKYHSSVKTFVSRQLCVVLCGEKPACANPREGSRVLFWEANLPIE